VTPGVGVSVMPLSPNLTPAQIDFALRALR